MIEKMSLQPLLMDDSVELAENLPNGTCPAVFG